ncbi:hypothetical protein FOZ62_016502, partial [Perkinsus olseni]
DTLFGKTTDPIVLPSRAAKPLWSRAHNLMCHPGSGSCYRRLSRHVIWHRMSRDIRTWTRACVICLKARRERQAKDTANKFRVKSLTPWQLVAIDYCGPYGQVQGRPSCLVATCAATNYVATVTVPDQTAKSFIHAATLLFNANGYPSILTFDSDRTFLSAEALSFLSAVGIQALCLPGYAVRVAWWERSHQLLHSCVRAALLDEPTPIKMQQLEAAISTATLAANETPRPQTKISPNQMMKANGFHMQPI